MMEKSALDMIFEQAAKNRDVRLEERRKHLETRTYRPRPRPVPNERQRELRQERREAIARLFQQHAAK